VSDRGEMVMKLPSVAKRGFKAVREEQARREKAKEMKKGLLWRFFITKKDPEDIPVRFLTEEPICFYEHTISEGGKFTNVPCIGDGCPHCEEKKPTYVAGWLVVDGREIEVDEKDSNGNKTGKKKVIKDRIKLLVRGMTTAGQLDRLSRKYGLLDKMWYVTRTGTGTDTVWNFDRGDTDELTDKQMKALFAQLPEELRDLDPYDIVEGQIKMAMELASGESDSSENEEEESAEDKEELKANVKSKIQKIDDSEDDEEVPAKKPARTLARKPLKKK
jgi:hypothetical protein